MSAARLADPASPRVSNVTPAGGFSVRDVIAAAEAEQAAAARFDDDGQTPDPAGVCVAHAQLVRRVDATRRLVERAVDVLEQVREIALEVREENARRTLLDQADADRRSRVASEHEQLVDYHRQRRILDPIEAAKLADLTARVDRLADDLTGRSRLTAVIRWVVPILVGLSGWAALVLTKGCAP